MPGLTPSSPINASGTARGLVSTIAQTFAGVKTFLAAAVFSAGVQLSLLFGTNGSGAADVVIKAGTTLADASVNAGAKLLSVRTGIGGTEVVKFAVTPAGIDLFQGAEINFRDVWGQRIYAQSGYVYVQGNLYATSIVGQYGIVGTALTITGFSVTPSNKLSAYAGAGAADVSNRIGTDAEDATVHASAKLLNVSTGLASGGTEVPSFQFLKGGVLWGNNAGNSVLRLNGTRGAELEYGGNLFTLTSIHARWTGAGPFIVENSQSDGADRSALYANCLNAWTNLTSSLLMLQNNEVSFFRVDSLSRVHQRGVDRSATVGADTQNNPIGINTLASGATSVVITNSLVSADSHVEVTFHADPGGRVWVTKAAGSFTVNVSAAPGANAPFSWEVKGLL